ncbi:hypothetical protein GCM10018952_28100 [Streptosporangium vulgare]
MTSEPDRYASSSVATPDSGTAVLRTTPAGEEPTRRRNFRALAVSTETATRDRARASSSTPARTTSHPANPRRGGRWRDRIRLAVWREDGSGGVGVGGRPDAR